MTKRKDSTLWHMSKVYGESFISLLTLCSVDGAESLQFIFYSLCVKGKIELANYASLISDLNPF